MQGPSHRPDLDYGRLSSFFRGLSVPSRLELLRKLQVPHAASDIILGPTRKARGRVDDRPLTRGAVEAHIRVLLDLGLVEEIEGDRDGRRVTEYVVDHAGLFRLVEEMRSLSLIRPGRNVAPGATQRGDANEDQVVELPRGPQFVLVSGPMEGTAFALRGDGPWAIGRERGIGISLPFDPFISRRNSDVRMEGRSYVITALPGARNGTRVNWRQLAENEAVLLERGDIIGVGRSLLVHQTPHERE